MRSFLNKPFILFVTLATFLMLTGLTNRVVAQQKEKVKLTSGTVVALSLEKAVNSDMAEGTNVDLRVVRDVTAGDKVVIKSGTLATATITDVNSSGAVGKAGKISIKLRSVKAVDGQEIFLRGSVDKQGDDKVVLSVVLALICLPLILINGGDANIPAGTEVRAYVEQDVMIEVQ